MENRPPPLQSVGQSLQNGEDINVDSMSYEELVQLEEMMGDAPRGAQENDIQSLPVARVAVSPRKSSSKNSPSPSSVSSPKYVNNAQLAMAAGSPVSKQECHKGSINSFQFSSWSTLRPDIVSAMEEDDNDDEEEKNCPICLEPFEEGNTVKTLPCWHMFHTQCIDKWLRMRNKCPVCSEPIGIRGKLTSLS